MDPTKLAAQAFKTHLESLPYEQWTTADLLSLHQSYAMRFVADNGNIWSTGAVFVPIAYAGPAVFFSLADRAWVALFGIMSASLGLAISWFFVAEGHRAFQNRSMSVLRGIEMKLGLEIGSPKLPDPDALARFGSRPAVATVRRSILALLVVLWAGIVVSGAVWGL